MTLAPQARGSASSGGFPGESLEGAQRAAEVGSVAGKGVMDGWPDVGGWCQGEAMVFLEARDSHAAIRNPPQADIQATVVSSFPGRGDPLLAPAGHGCVSWASVGRELWPADGAGH